MRQAQPRVAVCEGWKNAGTDLGGLKHKDLVSGWGLGFGGHF